jgi:hypothetical protein
LAPDCEPKLITRQGDGQGRLAREELTEINVTLPASSTSVHRAEYHPARGERILPKPHRPISETNFSPLAWEARTAQRMWGVGEAEAK